MAWRKTSDEQWAFLEPLLPPAKPQGRKRADLRTVLDGVLHRLRVGCQWRDLPERFGPWQTVYHHFNAWRRAGVLDALLTAVRRRAEAEGRHDHSLWAVDGTVVRAQRAAAGAPPHRASRRTTRSAAAVAD